MENIDLTGLSQGQIEYVTSLAKQKEDLSKEVENQKVRIDYLLELLLQQQKALFGQKSEKSRYIMSVNENQLSFFNEAELETDSKAKEPDVSTTVAAHQRKPKRTREELADSVPVIEVICDIDKDNATCDICGSDLRYLGKEHVRDELEIIPAQVRLFRYVRMNYVCTECEHETCEANIVKSPVPAPVMKRSLASASSVAYVMYQKYANGMPLYRQEKDWKNQGVTLSRATLANWIIRTSHDWLEPVYESMRKQLLQEPVIHTDETGIQVLKEDGRKPTTESKMWVYASGRSPTPVVLFEYQPTRSGQHAKRFLEGFNKYLVTDGFSGYSAVSEVQRCGCWGHLRRYFEQALPKNLKDGKSQAATGLEYCNKLFMLEKDMVGLSNEERYKERLEKSKPVLDEFWQWLDGVNALKGSSLGKAVFYARGQKEFLNRFLMDGCIEISNNRCENAIRPFVIGRKGWLFSDTKHGAKASATVYSMIETAKLNGLNPYMYLVHLFTNLPSIGDLTPDKLEAYLPWSEKLPLSCRNIRT